MTDETQEHEQTAIEQCITSELDRYFQLLDGDKPSNLYRMVVTQAEQALFGYVIAQCRGNQSQAAKYLGISRGTLRSKYRAKG